MLRSGMSSPNVCAAPAERLAELGRGMRAGRTEDDVDARGQPVRGVGRAEAVSQVSHLEQTTATSAERFSQSTSVEVRRTSHRPGKS